MKKILYIIFFLLSFSFKAIGQTNKSDKLTIEEIYFLIGINARQQNDFDEAVEYLTKSSKLGYIRAIHHLGDMYYEGKYISKDYDKAVYWFKKGAKKNDLRSMYFLGLIYSEKEYPKYNEKKAIKWFEKSSKKDYLLSSDALAFLKLNDSEQEELIQKLLEEVKAKNPNSMLELGKLYLTSSKYRDFEKGFYWIDQSTKYPKNPIGMCYLGFLYGEGISVKQDYYVAVMLIKDSTYSYEKANYWFKHYRDEKANFEQRIFAQKDKPLLDYKTSRKNK